MHPRVVYLRDFEEVLRVLALAQQVQRKVEELVLVVMKNEVMVGGGRRMSGVEIGATSPYLGSRPFPRE